MRRFALAALLLVALGALGFWVLTAPAVWAALRGHGEPAVSGTRNPDNGRELFLAGGCVSCHMSPGQDDRAVLGGGQKLPSPFGDFYPPNISPHPTDGIGSWTTAQFIHAMREGVSPDGEHYYPAFPYTSYQHMTANDLADLFEHIKTLPPVAGRVRDHDLPFPFNIRRGLGLWKLAFLDGVQIEPDPGKSAEWNRGRYLVEGPAHCAECHSPRTFAGSIVADRRFGGGPNPEGRGTVPNITPDATGIGGWSKGDIADLLKTGFTPDYDAVGGSMGPVIKNTSQLTDADRAAVAEYLKSVPAVKSEAKKPAG